jgi:DNA-binding MarR family transcriptional regulator
VGRFGPQSRFGVVPPELGLPFDPIARAEELWEQRWGSPGNMAAATSIMRVQQLLLARFDEVLKPHGLTFARYEALVLLAFSREGELPLGKIGQRLMVHPTSVTNIVQRLEQQGFVDRRPNPRDGRGALAALTEAGRDVMERATKDLTATGWGLDALGEGGEQILFRLLRGVRIAAGDFPDDAPVDGN